MSQTPITKRLFLGWLILFTFGMALWATPGEFFWGLGIGLITFSNLFLMPRQERSRPLNKRDLLWILGSLLGFAVFIFVSNQWLPDDLGAPVVMVIRHPAVVALLWGLAVFLTYRRYKVAEALTKKED
jgi:quinol-cytochrome oxidoreductase complex cytochrome b subunit